MLHRLRLFVPLLVVLSVVPVAEADLTGWDAAFNHQIDAKSDQLPNGRGVFRVRYRGKAGDVVWATLRGLSGKEEGASATPLRSIVLEFDPSGGRGEWELANEGEGAMGFEIRAPDSGVVEFRVRAKTPGVTEYFSLEYGADTTGPKPLMFCSNEIKSSIQDGYEKVYPLNAKRGNISYEFEVWAQGFSPTMKLTDPKGNDLDFTPLDNGPTYRARRYAAPTDGQYRITIGSDGRTGGSFLLRTWYPLPLQKRK